MEWFCGILLPAGFEQLTYHNITLKHIGRYATDFTNQPIYRNCNEFDVIGKIKSVWIDNDGQLMVAGYLTKECTYNELAIMFCKEGEKYSNFACSLTNNAYYAGCKIIKRQKINVI